MVLQVARTTYETSPDKKLAAVDVYTATVDSTPINNETKLPTTSNNISDIGYTPNSLSKLYTETSKAFKDPTKTLDQALSILGGVVKNPREFAKSLTNDILADTLRSVGYKGTSDDLVNMLKQTPSSTNILDILGNSDADLKVIIGDVEKMVASKDLGTVNGIASLVNELSGNDNLIKVLNISPKISVVKSFMNEAMKLRLPEVVDLLIDTIDSEDDKRELKLRSTLNAAYNSDVSFINNQINDPNIGPGAIGGMYPTIVSVFLSNYVLVNAVPTAEQAAILITMLDKIDSNWLSYDRDGHSIHNLSDLSTASEDAIAILLKDERTFLPATLSRGLDLEDITVATLKLRPLTPVSVLSA